MSNKTAEMRDPLSGEQTVRHAHNTVEIFILFLLISSLGLWIITFFDAPKFNEFNSVLDDHKQAICQQDPALLEGCTAANKQKQIDDLQRQLDELKKAK